VTGFWRLSADPGFVPDADLAAFLDAGPPPIYVGFGSMMYDPSPTLRAVARLARTRGWRFVIGRGWLAGAVPRLDTAGVHVVGDVPHSWLLPRVALAVHHGGAGTTAASLSAGLPTLIAWFIVDQVFWAKRVQALGVGLDLGAHAHLSEAALESAISRAMEDDALRARAGSLGEQLRGEDGAQTAAREIAHLTLTTPLGIGRA
jgi:UDP:flavonoid glycosyltransferase YjiC (YdhE family)